MGKKNWLNLIDEPVRSEHRNQVLREAESVLKEMRKERSSRKLRFQWTWVSVGLAASVLLVALGVFQVQQTLKTPPQFAKIAPEAQEIIENLDLLEDLEILDSEEFAALNGEAGEAPLEEDEEIIENLDLLEDMDFLDPEMTLEEQQTQIKKRRLNDAKTTA